MPFVSGWLRVRRGGHPDQGLPGGESGPTDPDYGIDEGAGPDNELPGRPPGFWGGERPSLPVRPGHLPAYGGRPVDPGYGVPLPPITEEPPVDPDFGVGRPPHAGHPLPPTYPVRPDQGLPRPPHVWPRPPSPPEVWPPVTSPPISPEHPIYPVEPGSPTHPIVLPPGAVWPPLPPSITGTVTCFVWVVGCGYRWITIDPNLQPEHPIAGGGEPPVAQPRRG